MKKTLITAVTMSALLFNGLVYADDHLLAAETENFDEIYVGKITTNENDNSDILVEVFLTSATGESTVIYTGALGGYGDVALNEFDFSETDAVVIFDWDSSDMIYIKPMENLISGNLSTNQKDSVSMFNAGNNLMLVSEDLEISSQIKINGVNVGGNGLRIVDNANISCTFNISNESEISKSFAPVLVTYDESGVMQNVRTVEVEVNEGEMESVQIIYQFDAEKEYTAKLMMWDSLSGMIPLRATIDFTQTSGVNAYYYNKDNRLLQVDKANGTSLIYTYDNMGNLLTKTISMGGNEDE